MKQWTLTLTGSHGTQSVHESGEAQFVIGSEEAPDVLRVFGEGIAPRHAWVWLAEGCMQVEDIAGGTLVNGHAIEGRVEVDYPSSLQVGEVTVYVEVKAVRPDESLAVTIARASSGSEISSPDARGLPATTPHGTAGSAAPQVQSSGSDEARMARAVSDYRLVREIARGGMGQIYFGEDPQLKRQVAVKVSSVAYGGEDPRFAKEAEVLAHLAHPNIVPIHNLGVDGQGRPFYSMKLVKGRTLQAILNALREGDAAVVREYTRATLLTVFRKVCDAMAFAHAKGVLHRDLKPENIMVGEYGEVLVMDWGLAKVLGERDAEGASKVVAGDTGDYGMTLEGEVMGTPQYMSPEQAEGMVAELDARSDIYSLGGILYAILALRPPIEGGTLNEVLTKVKRGEISPISTKRIEKGVVGLGKPQELGVEVPEALQAVTLKAMARERNKRYASVEAVAADIEAYQNGFATSAEQAGLLKRTRLWVGRNRLLSGALVVLGVVVAGFTVRLVNEGRRANRAMESLRKTAPTFALRAENALRDGAFQDALEAAAFASELEPLSARYLVLKGHALQVLTQWNDAVSCYTQALQLEAHAGAEQNLQLTRDLLDLQKKGDMSAALRRLYGSLNEQSRQYEALGMEKDYPEVGSARVRKSGEAAALIQKMEKNLLPIPGTDVFMGKYEVSVGEWKQYLDAEGLPPWEQPWLNACRDLKRNPKEAHMIVGNPALRAGPFEQEDTHPVVYLSLEQVNQFCDWLCLKTGKKWRLPRESEWLAAIGGKKNPWGDNFPPGATDGNYAMAEDGSFDPSVRGVDGFLGTAPVGSFRANLYGFHDLAGNAWEPVSLTGRAEKKWTMMGGGWAAGVPSDQSDGFRSARRIERDARGLDYGLRLVRE